MTTIVASVTNSLDSTIVVPSSGNGGVQGRFWRPPPPPLPVYNVTQNNAWGYNGGGNDGFRNQFPYRQVPPPPLQQHPEFMRFMPWGPTMTLFNPLLDRCHTNLHIPGPNLPLYPCPFPQFPFNPPTMMMNDPQINAIIQRQILLYQLRYQIEYYFCDNNLAGDVFLKRNMDDEGWVSIHVIAKFPRVVQLTDKLNDIRDALWNSHSVQLRGNKMRKRYGWAKFCLPRELRIVQSP